MPAGSEWRILTEYIFWAASAFVFYTYAGYPILIFLASRIKTRPPAVQDFVPPVTIIMAIHNGEQLVRKKLDNLLALDYPRDLLNILVVSDASTDGTDRIVAEYADSRIRLHAIRPRQGKHHAQMAAIQIAESDILVFTDVAPLLATDSLRQMMCKFADPEVGCVGGEDRVLLEGDEISREGSYIEYDMLIRRWESRVGSCVGVSGAFFAARRQICEPWWPDRSSDFMVALQAVRRGFRTISDAEAVHFYKATQSLRTEYRRKKRTALNGMIVFIHSLGMLNVFRYGLFSWQYVSHKLCRWLTPVALVGLFAASVVLAMSSDLYRLPLALQLMFYSVALAGIVLGQLRRFKLVQICVFFVMANIAIVAAWFELGTGRTGSIWEPTVRP